MTAQEVRLYCFSEERAAKERGIVERFAQRFEDALTQLSEGPVQTPYPETTRQGLAAHRPAQGEEPRHRPALRHRAPTPNESGERATAVRFTRRALPGSMMTHPGVYCLRSSETDWDEATLWRTYFTLTDLEAVFRSLKSELGLRPIYHHKPIRADGHLFITVIAYQLVQVIRTRLRSGRRECELDHATAHPRRTAAHHRYLPPWRRAHPRTCARRPVPNRPSRRSTTPWASDPLREEPARHSCRRSSKAHL